MHMRGTPATMQHDPRYDDAAGEVREALARRLAAALAAGVAPENIVVDPGIGFGKTLRHNLELLARIEELAPLGRPIMIGVSRKGFLGVILDQSVDERLEGGLAAAAIAAFLGARVVRTHDVADTVKALRVAADALRDARRAGSNA
jgi:dihydropteroate synthase